MNTQIARYLFWILTSLPLFALGLFLVYKLLDNLIARSRAQKKVIREKQLKQQRRQEFEERYSRRRGGGSN